MMHGCPNCGERDVALRWHSTTAEVYFCPTCRTSWCESSYPEDADHPEVS